MATKKPNAGFLANKTKQDNSYLTGKLIKTGIILVLVAGLMYFWAFAIFSNIDTFWEFLSKGKDDLQPYGQDTTPPSPPFLEDLPKQTNKINIKISGYSESGASVKLFFNGRDAETVIANNEGYFSFSEINLLPGSNKFYTIATDTAGNQSQPSTTQEVLFDNKEPEVTITQPQQGQIFIGEDYRVKVAGSTESETIVLINNHIALQDSQGNFSHTVALERVAGEKTITIKVTDQAGNTIEKYINVIYHP